MFKRLRQLLRRGRGEEGVAAVELAIVLPLLLFLMLGGMDLGHMYYIEYIITNASREGARYASKYTVTTTSPPTSIDISTYVKSTLNYNSFNFGNFSVGGSYSGGSPNIVTVTVKADKQWWILGTFTFFGFRRLTNPMTLTGQTAMTMETPS
jgi:Flp pilus assembly protein TadG